MKRISALILSLVLIFSFAGCRKNNKTSSAPEQLNSGVIKVEIEDETDDKYKNNSSKEDNESNNNSGNNSDNKNSNPSAAQNNTSGSNSQTPSGNGNLSGGNNNSSATESETADIKEFKAIKCRAIANTEWKKAEIVVKSSKLSVNLNIPEDWEISSDGNIMIAEKNIGKISTSAPKGSADSYEKESRTKDDVEFTKTVDKYTAYGKNLYERHFKAQRLSSEGSLFKLYLTIDYAQLDDTAANKLYSSITYIGLERAMPQMNNSSKKFLILGDEQLSESNSKIESIFGYMLGGSGYTVEVKANESFNIEDFAADTALLSKIENGDYSYVFLSGGYNSSLSVSDNVLKKILAACDKSNTRLILFPSYSENSSIINTLLDKHTTLFCINWKEEIELFINSGISNNTNLTKKDFINNECYTPLAGYVGAHMLYLNIFGKIPPELSENSPHSMSDITSKLGSYTQTGIIPGQLKTVKYYI